MKVALIIPGSLWYAPYMRIYTRLLDRLGTDYGVISWNREGDDQPEGFQYQVRCPQGHGSASMSAYWGYVRFIRQTVRHEGFDRIVVFGPQMACLLAPMLLRHYRHRYIIDYRDLSIEQRPVIRQLFALMLRYSYANVVSSPGFLPHLPKATYFISHNMSEYRPTKTSAEGSMVNVLTIGAIRDTDQNLEVVKSLANHQGFTLHFVGKGHAAPVIEAYCKEHGVTNVKFHGFYEKEEEAAFVDDCTVMNIYYPRIVTHDTALSNRFYLSLQHHRPMIVTRGTTQGDYAERYGVGIAVDDCLHLADQILAFLATDRNAYEQRCDALLAEFMKDQERFECVITHFVSTRKQ